MSWRSGLPAPGGARDAGRLLDELAASTVVVIGDAMLDRYLRGDAERISPEAPVPVVRVRESEAQPGGAANVAAGVAALGAEVRLVAATGADRAAEELSRRLSDHGVDAGRILAVAGRRTTEKTRVIGDGQQMLRLDRESREPLEEASARRLLASLEEALGGADAVAVADYGKGLLDGEVGRRVLRSASERELPVVADPCRGRCGRYRGATVLTPNAEEAAAAAGGNVPAGAEALDGLRRGLGVEHLLVTLGPDGMRLAGPDGAVSGIPGRPVEVYDVTGAGDTVTAVVAASLGRTAGLETAARLANRAAALEVQKLGARPVGRTELREALPAP